MNDELLEIHDLLKVEVELEALKAEAGALAASVKKRRARVGERESEEATAREDLKVVRRAELDLQRRLDDYVRQRDRTKDLIDTGRAPDFLAAERQVKGCQEVVDRLEGELLEAMEAREAVEKRIAVALEGVGIEKARVRDALERQRTRRPEVETRWKVIAPLRKERRGALAPDLLRKYDDLRGRSRPVLIKVIDGSCEFCHMRVQPNIIQNFDRDRLASCSGCGCWLREVVDTSPDSDADDE